MKHRRKGGSPKTDVTKIAYVIKPAKQYENGMHLRPAQISIIYGNGFFLHLMAIGSSINNMPLFFFLYTLKLEITISFCVCVFFLSFFALIPFNLLNNNLLFPLTWVWTKLQDIQQAQQSLGWSKYQKLVLTCVYDIRPTGCLHP